MAMPGIGDTGGSLILSVRTLVSLLAMTVVDRYYRLLDVRRGVFLTCLFTCGGFLIYSVAASLPVFFAGAVFLGLGYGLGGNVAMTYLANRWFASGIGTVVGFAAMGSGLASIVMPLMVVRVIEGLSLQAAFVVEGIIAGLIGLLVFALIRNGPSEMGLRPHESKDGKGRKAHANRQAPKAERALLLAAIAMVGVFSCGAITYLSVLATSSGFTPVFAATLASASGVALTLAKVVAGELFDRLGAPLASGVMFAFALVGFALACTVGSGNTVLMVDLP